MLAADPRCGSAPPAEMHLNLPARAAACTAGAACRAPKVAFLYMSLLLGLKTAKLAGRCALLPPVKRPPTAATPRSRGFKFAVLCACLVKACPTEQLCGLIARLLQANMSLGTFYEARFAAEGMCESELRDVRLLTSLHMMQHFLTFALL